MVGFKEFEYELPDLFEDVKKFTVDELGFKKDGENLSATPILLKEDRFNEKASELGVKATKGFLSFKDGNIYLNYNELNDELYRERTIAILSHFTPYTYVLEETKYGKWVKEETRKAIDSGNIREKIKSLVSFPLGGICKAVELDATKAIKGYRLDEIEKELEEDLEFIKEKYPQMYKGYERCRELQKRATEFKGDVDDVTRKRIIKASLEVAGGDKNFESNYESLDSAPLEEIYAMAGGDVLLPKALENIEKLAGAINFKASDYQQWRYIKPRMEELVEELRLKGFPKDLREKLTKQLENCSVMKYRESFRKELIDSTKELMEEVVNYCEKASKRPVKIGFR